MRTLYTIALVCLANVFTSEAQTFNWVTTNTIETNLDLNTTVLLKMEQSAVGTDTVTLGIEVTYNDLPAAWDGMVCIHGQCLGIIPPVGTTAEMSPISGSEFGYVRLTVNPLTGTEVAKLQIYVYDLNFPNDGDTATWLLNTTLSANELTMLEQPVIYPNPVQENLKFNTVENITTVGIYDFAGTLVKEVSVAELQNSSLDVSNLESGMYIIRFADEGGNSVSNKFQKL